MAQIGLPDIGLFEAIYSARSIRRLKPDPVCVWDDAGEWRVRQIA